MADTFVLHGARRRLGRARRSVEVRAEPIVVHLDQDALAVGPALAIRDEIRQAVRDVRSSVSSATREKRDYQARAWQAGRRTRSLQIRFSEQRPPKSASQTPFALNHSGALAEGIRVERRTGDMAVVLPRHRDQPELLVSMRSRAPKVFQPSKLVGSPRVQKAIEKTARLVHAKADSAEHARAVESKLRALNATERKKIR